MKIAAWIGLWIASLVTVGVLAKVMFTVFMWGWNLLF